MKTISEINELTREVANSKEDWEHFFDDLKLFYLRYFNNSESLVSMLAEFALQLYCDLRGNTLDIPEIFDYVVPCEKLGLQYAKGLITFYEMWSSQLLKDFEEIKND